MSNATILSDEEVANE